MQWNDSRVLDSICYDLVLGEYPRSLNRTMIDDLANGVAPYTDTEVEENNINVNVNDLTHTRKMHDGRTQFSNAFMKTGNFVTCKTEDGPVHKRTEWSSIVTQEFNRPLRNSISYFERQRAKFGMLVLHGISPGCWENEDKWCAKPLGVEDVLIPARTLLGFENLPFFALRRSFTAIELMRITAASKRDPGWNMGMVDRVLKWIDTQTMQLRSTNWADVWKPEATAERVKEDTGYYMGDQVPTIDCFDIYAYDDSECETGWIRRIILDSWSTPSLAGGDAVQHQHTELGPLPLEITDGIAEGSVELLSDDARPFGALVHGTVFGFAGNEIPRFHKGIGELRPAIVHFASMGQVVYICDSTKGKWYHNSPGRNIPVTDEGALLRELPDYAIMTCWNFAFEVMNNQKLYLEKGGKFIMPLPTVKIIP